MEVGPAAGLLRGVVEWPSLEVQPHLLAANYRHMILLGSNGLTHYLAEKDGQSKQAEKEDTERVTPCTLLAMLYPQNVRCFFLVRVQLQVCSENIQRENENGVTYWSVT